MVYTQILELQLSTNINPNKQNDLYRSVILHLLREKKMKMQDALDQLLPHDQQWLVNTIIQTAQENLYVTCHISNENWSQKYWQQYGDLLEHLPAWYHKDTDVSYHGQLLSILRTIVHRYSSMQLTAQQLEYIQRLTIRLHEKQLSQKDISEITHTLENNSIQTLLDLSPVVDELFDSYTTQLGQGFDPDKTLQEIQYAFVEAAPLTDEDADDVRYQYLMEKHGV